MRQRCHDPNFPRYAQYGAVGITVCDKWRHSFAAFLTDMGDKPSPQMSIDRIDGRRGYEPGNCRWATATEQNHNKRNTLRFVDLNDQPLTAKEIAHCLAMPRDVVYYRLAGGRYGRA